ncbi:MAG: Hpt domain [Pseudomonadota bacterium]
MKALEATRTVTDGGHVEPLWSTYMDDPVVRPLLPAFAKALDERVKRMGLMLSAGDFVELARLAHMVRGAAGSYGYSQIADLAGAVETGARAGTQASTITPLVSELAAMGAGVSAAVASIDPNFAEWNSLNLE